MQATLPSILEVARAGTFGIKLPALPPYPFVGLRPFESDEALLFFGRREQTIELMQQLHRTHFVAVVGSSGCGKSSLVRAGLIPKLEAGFLAEDRDQWLILLIKPGTTPFQNLAEVLLSAMNQAATEAALNELVADLRARGVVAVIERLSSMLTDVDANLLLLVDQFEEIFRFGIESNNPASRAEATAFVELMLALSRQRLLPIYVVMTMRSDFIGDCDNFHGLPEAMNRSQYLVPRLTREQLRQSVEGPINLFGGSIAPQLVERVLNDVGDKSDQLPVMQHALMRTWEEWQADNKRSGKPQIDIEHYKDVGGIKNALSLDAEAALSGMSKDDLKITERMFQALTDTDARGRRIRRPVRVSEIANIAGADRQKVLAIIERFISGGRSFLTLTKEADPLVDISHESLIRQWERMSSWVEAEAESRAIYLRLVDAAKRHQKGSAEYWHGTDLQTARAWMEQRGPTRQWAARYSGGEDDYGLALDFLIASGHAERKAVEEREQQRKRELRRARTFAAVVGVLFLLALSAAWWAWRQQQEAKRQEAEAKRQEENARQLYYVANMNLAQEAYANNNLGRVHDLLNSFLPSPTVSDLALAREFYWYHLWLSAHQKMQTLEGHKGKVRSVTFAADGKTLASASEDGTVKLWDRATGKELATLKGHEGEVYAVAFAPDSKTLASASEDGTIKLWDRATGKELATLKGHEGKVYAVAFAPDSKTLASASEDGTIKLWDQATRKELATLKGHKGEILSVAFAPDGKTLASAGKDHTVKLWEQATGKELATLKGHEDGVRAVAFAPDGKMLASGSSDTTIKLWDRATGKELTTLKGQESQVYAVAFAPDGKTLASGGYSTVIVWDRVTGQALATLKGHGGGILSFEDIGEFIWGESGVSVAFAPDGQILASAGGDSMVELWDQATEQSLATLKGHEHNVRAVAFAPDGKILASASDDNTVKLWDWATGKVLTTFKRHLSSVMSVTFAPDGQMLASVSEDGVAKLWERATGKELATLEGHESKISDVAFTPDGKTLASASEDGTIKLWDRATGKELTTLKEHEGGITSVAITPDGGALASAGEDGTIKLWDRATGKELGRLKAHEKTICSVAFAPDGKTLASASVDGTIKLWDRVTGKALAVLKGHEGLVLSVTFTPDGKTLASGSTDGTIKLWDRVTGQALATLKGHKGMVDSVAFAPDGKTLASGGSASASGGIPSALDGLPYIEEKGFAIRLWFAATDEEVARQRIK